MPTASGPCMEDLKPMNCHNHHHACPCREELFMETLEALASIVDSVDAYEKSLAPYDKVTYRKFFLSIPSARSVLRRGGRKK